jgi:hypothetical protein
VSKRELGTGVRAFPATGHPHVGQPPLELADFGELNHHGTVSDPPADLGDGHPVLLLGGQWGVTHRTADGEANRVLEAGI